MKTRDTTWEIPPGFQGAQQPFSRNEPKWRQAYDPTSGKNYWYHVDTKETTWTMPPGFQQKEFYNSNAPILLNKHCISASIIDRYATIVYSFDFANTGNNAGSTELKFEMTIDPKAFISSFEANIDDELFIGKTKTKEKAAKEYSKAKTKNENAILISQPYDNIPNVFEIKTNIDSKSKISLNITIEQYLIKQFDFNQLIIEILKNFDRYNIKQNYEHISFKLNVADKSGIYDIIMNDKDKNDDIIINDKVIDKLNQNCTINGKIMNKTSISSINELILKYKIKGEQDGSQILYDNKSNTFCHIISDIITDSVMDDEKDIDEGYTDDIKENVLIPRRVIFCIDRSGSMGGMKWDKTISSTIETLKQLRLGHDRYCMILFDHNIELYPNTNIVSSDKTNVNDSIQYLQNKNVGGATNINDSLLKAIELIKNDIKLCPKFFMNQIIFITDGEPNSGVSDTKQIITNVKNANNLANIDKYSSKISIFSFGVGKDSNDSSWISDLNHSFLKVLSINNNGIYKRIKQSNTDTLLNEYYGILSKPVLSNIDIKYDNKFVKLRNLTQTRFHTLYSGNDIIVCGQIEKPKDNNHNVSELCITSTISAITGKQNKDNDGSLSTKPINIRKEIKMNVNIADINDENENNKIERIWAYLKLQQFAKNKLIYNDMIEVDDDEKKNDESLPVSLAMKYKFVTPWTSMIVVKHKQNEQQIQPQQPQQIQPQQPQQQQQQQQPQILYNPQSQLNMMQGYGQQNAFYGQQNAFYGQQQPSGSVIHFDAAWGSDSDDDDDGGDSWDDDKDDSSSDDDGLDVYDPSKHAKKALGNTLVNDEPSESDDQDEKLQNTFDDDENLLITDNFNKYWNIAQQEGDKYSFNTFAETNFVQNKHGVDELIKYTPYKKVTSAVTKMDTKLNKLAQQIWKHINSFMSLRSSGKSPMHHIEQILRIAFKANDDLRDEIFCQLMKQINGVPTNDALIKGWKLMAICCCMFPPSQKFVNYLSSYLLNKVNTKQMSSSLVAEYATFALKSLDRTMEFGPRCVQPTESEIKCIEERQPISIKLYFLDNTFKKLLITSQTTAKQIMSSLSKALKLNHGESFGLFEMEEVESGWERQIYAKRENMERQAKIDNLQCMPYDNELDVNEKIMDVYSSWTRSAKKKQRKIRLVFKCKLHSKSQEKSYSANDWKIAFLTTVWNVIHGMYPLEQEDVYHLAALQLQATHGIKENGFYVTGIIKDCVDKYVPYTMLENSNTSECESKILSKHGLYKHLDKHDVYKKYIGYLRKSNISDYFGCSFFRCVRVSRANKTNIDDLVIGISENGLIFIHPMKLSIVEKHKLEEILTYGFRSNAFLFVAGTLMTQCKYQFATMYGKQMNNLLRAHIDVRVAATQ